MSQGLLWLLVPPTLGWPEVKLSASTSHSCRTITIMYLETQSLVYWFLSCFSSSLFFLSFHHLKVKVHLLSQKKNPPSLCQEEANLLPRYLQNILGITAGQNVWAKHICLNCFGNKPESRVKLSRVGKEYGTRWGNKWRLERHSLQET